MSLPRDWKRLLEVGNRVRQLEDHCKEATAVTPHQGGKRIGKGELIIGGGRITIDLNRRTKGVGTPMLYVMSVERLDTQRINVDGRPESVLDVAVRLIWLASVRKSGNGSNSSKHYQHHRRGRLCQHHRQEEMNLGKVKEEELRIKGCYRHSKLCISGVEDMEGE